MPILKPAGYKNNVPHLFKESLLNNQASLVVAYGLDKGSHIEYEGTEDEKDFQERFPLRKKEALENLKFISPNVEFQEIEGSKIAFVTGHEYASEKILDKEFMISLADQIGDNSLMVGVPFKGHMIAAGSSSGLRTKLPPVIQKYYDNPQQDIISPYTYLVENEEVIGMGGENLPDESNQNVSISEDFNTHDYTVNVSCSSIDELKEIVNSSYQRIMLMIMKNKEFGGNIYYKLTPPLDLTEELKSRCNSFVDQIKNNEMAQTIVKAIATNGINPSFHYNGAQIAPELSKEKQQEKWSNDEKSAKSNYKGMSVAQLDKEYYAIVSVPNARTNVDALVKMTALMKEYEKRNIEMPDTRSSSQKTTDKSSNNTKENGKPWWKFW